MESENSSLAQQLSELRAANSSLQTELDSLSQVKLELASACELEVRIRDLEDEVKELVNLNKDLKDQNDELNLLIEDKR